MKLTDHRLAYQTIVPNPTSRKWQWLFRENENLGRLWNVSVREYVSIQNDIPVINFTASPLQLNAVYLPSTTAINDDVFWLQKAIVEGLPGSNIWSKPETAVFFACYTGVPLNLGHSCRKQLQSHPVNILCALTSVSKPKHPATIQKFGKAGTGADLRKVLKLWNTSLCSADTKRRPWVEGEQQLVNGSSWTIYRRRPARGMILTALAMCRTVS